MKKSPLLGALPIIAKAVGRQLGVQVVVGARQASTDGRTIFLPALPVESAPLAILAHGYIDHEAAHLRYTDFTVEKPDGFVGHLMNGLEDIRIERELGAVYPGSRANLARLVAYLEAQDPSSPDAEASIQALVSTTLNLLLRAEVLGQAVLAPTAAAFKARLHATLPPGVVIKLLALALEVRNTRSTAEVKGLALRIVESLEEEAQSPSRPSSSGGSSEPSADDAGSSSSAANDPSGSRDPSGSSSAAGDPAGVSGEASGSSSAANDPSGSRDPSGSSSAAGDPAGVSGEASASLSASGAASGAGTDDPRQAALRALLAGTGADDGAAIADVGARARQALNALTDASEAATVTVAEEDPLPAHRSSMAAVAHARAATAALRRRLGALVQAVRDDDDWRSRRGRRLDNPGLYRLAVQDPTLFRRRLEREAPNTAVGLLLDRSDSMHREIALASQAVLATLLALEEIPGIACWAAAFPGSKASRVIPLKRFTERARRVAGRFDLTIQGSTPLAGALWRAGYELAQRPEPRRLLIVATDGDPDDVAAAQRIIARCRASGIEVLGLGIGQSLAQVQAVFGVPDAAAIGGIEALAPALFRLLERRLTQAA